jgi:hypothetical protein
MFLYMYFNISKNVFKYDKNRSNVYFSNIF